MNLTEAKKKEKLKLMGSTIFVDCALLDTDYFAVMGVKDMGEEYDPWETLAPAETFIYWVGEEEAWVHAAYFPENSVKNPMIAHGDKPSDLIIIDADGGVYYLGTGNNKHWEKNGIGQRGIQGIKNIHGTIYAVGLMRSVFRRDGKDQWTHISQDLSTQTKALKDDIKAKGGKHLWTGFDDIDGFEADKDLYAVGGNGDVWHYNGQKWHAIDIPLSKMQIKKICCAEDGFVYIVGHFGAVVKGRKNQWEALKHAAQTEFSDVVSYQGQVYIASGDALWQVEGDEIKRYTFNSEKVPANYGYLYVNHNLMMSAGRRSAAIFDGEKWKILYDSTTNEQSTKNQENKVKSFMTRRDDREKHMAEIQAEAEKQMEADSPQINITGLDDFLEKIKAKWQVTVEQKGSKVTAIAEFKDKQAVQITFLGLRRKDLEMKYKIRGKIEIEGLCEAYTIDIALKDSFYTGGDKDKIFTTIGLTEEEHLYLPMPRKAQENSDNRITEFDKQWLYTKYGG